MKVTIEDGAHAGETFEINEKVWKSGFLLIPERTRPALQGDAFAPIRVARYMKRRMVKRGIVFFVWVWNGWERQ